jgi:hypothetical protein
MEDAALALTDCKEKGLIKQVRTFAGGSGKEEEGESLRS